MSLFNILRGIFGMPPDSNANRSRRDFPEERPNEFRNPIWSLDDDDDDDDFRRPRSRFSFSVDTNPLEIHRFFEQQMEDMMRSLGSFGFGNFGRLFTMEPPPMESDSHFIEPAQPSPSGLRDQFLKPDFDREDSRAGERMDSDLDDKLTIGDLGKMLQQRPSLEVVEPEGAFISRPGVSGVFGRSVTSKTITRPGRGTEHHKRVRDSAGNEVVTVTRTMGSQAYSITTKTDSSGRQERVEKFVNMEEGDLKEFEKKWGSKL